MLVLNSCSRHDNKPISIVSIKGDYIPNELVLNETETQGIYDHLCRIYDIRRAAAESFTEGYVLNAEAQRLNISTDSLVSTYVLRHLTEKRIAQTIESEMIGSQISIATPDGPKLVYTGSDEGLRELQRLTAELIRLDFIDSLRTAYDVKICIPAPIGQKLSISTKTLTRIPMKSAVGKPLRTFTLFADPDCKACRKAYSQLSEATDSLDDDIELDFVCHTPSCNVSSKAIVAASRQNLGPAMLDMIMTSSTALTLKELLLIADDLGLDTARFSTDLADRSLDMSIDSIYEFNNKAGVVETPTVLLDNRPLYKGYERNILIANTPKH
ncbi:MAG: hypothetical protein II951_09305 [Bacteroidales bacterium]|nr:hypothetical protein [Bacteroidales bacterium]